MFGYRKILCVTDLSEPSLRALEAARQLAVPFSAEVVILHVVDMLPVSPSDKTLVSRAAEEAAPRGQIPFNVTQHLEDLMKGAEETMERQVSRKTSEMEEVRIEVREGFAPVEIVKAADEMAADLIVIAARGGQGPEQNRAGSITQQVVRDASVSVLTVR
jgi:universal stress protein A